jgi:hypothetical protein
MAHKITRPNNTEHFFCRLSEEKRTRIFIKFYLQGYRSYFQFRVHLFILFS